MMTMGRRWALAAELMLAGALSLYAQAPHDAASNLDRQIAALEKLVLQKEQQAPGVTAASPPASSTNLPSLPPMQSRSSRFFYQLQHDVLRKDYVNAINAANNLEGVDTSDGVQKALAEIVPELQELKDAQEAQVKDQLKGLLDRTTKVVTMAKDPKELDPVLVEIGNAINQSRSGAYNPARQAEYTQLESVSRFVKEWQSYLIDENAGNSMQASNDLRELANMSDTYMPIPRSEILARALKVSGAAPQALDSKIEVHSLDDVPAAISQLQMLQRSGNYSVEMNNLMSSLQGLQNAYLAYQDKNYTGALQALQNYPFMVMGGAVVSGVAGGAADKAGAHDSLRKEIMALKDTLLIEIVQGLLAMPDLPAPEKDERASEYLLRLAALKEKAEDWNGLLQVLGVYQQVAGMYNPQTWLQEDVSGLHSYLVGEKLEAAGQNLDAIRSYRQALATLGKYFPAEPPAAKLKELEKKYPELYQQALQQPIWPKGP